jgi:hypothetical protein
MEIKENEVEMKTYRSREAKYSLDSSKVFDVVGDLGHYILAQKRLSDDIINLRTSINPSGSGIKLFLSAEVTSRPPFLDKFDLASLTLSDHGKGLELRINPHPAVCVDPSDLYIIGENYSKG